MSHPMNVARTLARRTALLAAGAALGVSACDTTGHDFATVDIESDQQTTVRVITSFSFGITFEEGREVFHLLSGDTAWVDLPFSQDYDLRTTGRFYVRAAESEDPLAAISMRVRVDGRQQYFHEAVLEAEGLQFYYVGR